MKNESSNKIPDGWHIQYNPKPIPDRRFDYDFWHDNYDYAEDTGSNGLAGNGDSVSDCINQIEELDNET